jgi:hypothetical protein
VGRRLPIWIWLPIGAALGLAAARLILAPRVVERVPAPGTSAPATAEIRLAFDQAMEETSVVDRLHVLPSQAGEIGWQGNGLVYRPTQAWTPGSTVEVRLDAGARSLRGLSMLTGTRWSFTVSAPRIVYLWPADGETQIYARGLGAPEATALTAAQGGVSEYSIGANGTRLLYITEVSGGSTELRELDLGLGADRLLYSCPPEERCTSAVLSPDGSRLAYVSAPRGPGDGVPGGGRVWVLEEGADAPAPVSPAGDTALAPFWSPQGWLAFVDASRGAFHVVDREPYAPLAVVPTLLGERGAWSPDGRLLVYPDLVPLAGGESLAGLETHLFAWDVARGSLTDLTAVGAWQAEDSSPSFTPDGEWVIFSRRLHSPGRWTQGKQLWRMRADGTQAEALTDEPLINHGAPAVGPQGDSVAYLRYDLQAPLDPAQVWRLDLGTRRGELVAEGGYLPGWIP